MSSTDQLLGTEKRPDHLHFRVMGHGFQINQTHGVTTTCAALINQVFNFENIPERPATGFEWLRTAGDTFEILEVMFIQGHRPTILKKLGGIRHQEQGISKPYPTMDMSSTSFYVRDQV
jgi:hypothetical protein